MLNFQGWKQNILSHARVLIKILTIGVLIYPMHCFQFPKKWFSKIDSLIANFWWGKKEKERKIHWKKWEDLADLEWMGGMRFKDIANFNLAQLTKMA